MSFGSVVGAIISQKNNKRSRSSKIDRYVQITGGEIPGVHSHRRPSSAELENIRQRITSENQKRQWKVIYIRCRYDPVSLRFYLFDVLAEISWSQ